MRRNNRDSSQETKGSLLKSPKTPKKYAETRNRWNALAVEGTEGLVAVTDSSSSNLDSPVISAVQRFTPTSSFASRISLDETPNEEIKRELRSSGLQTRNLVASDRKPPFSQDSSRESKSAGPSLPSDLPTSPIPTIQHSDFCSPRPNGRPLHHSELAVLKQRFRELDASGKGVLSRSEFYRLFISIVELPNGVDASENSPVFEFAYNLFDSAENKGLDLKEFISGCWILCGSEEERVRLLFHMYDKDNSGGLSLDELKTVFRVMRSFAIAKEGSEAAACESIGLPGHRRCQSESNMQELAERAMKEQDMDKDGQIGFDDFQMWCVNNPIVKVWMDMLSHDTARGIAKIRDERERELLAKELLDIGLMNEKFMSITCSPKSSCLQGGSGSSGEYSLTPRGAGQSGSFTAMEQKSDATMSGSIVSEQAADAITNFEIEFDKLSFERRIGEGSFAEVFSGRWLDSEVAIKVFNSGSRVVMNSNGTTTVVPQGMGGETLDNISFDPDLLDSSDEEYAMNVRENTQERNSDGRSRFLQEVALLMSLRHPHVLFYIGACVHPQFPLCIVSELIDGGSLYSLLHGRGNKKLTIKEKFKLTQDVARGMFYLHSRSPVVLHRDLKAANILVERKKDNEIKATIIDFGLSKLSSSDISRSNVSGLCGSLVTMAPEIMSGGCYRTGSDVYSFGIITWEIFTGRIPFRGIAAGQLIHMVSTQKKRPKIKKSDEVPEGIKLLIEKCWEHELRNRIEFKYIVQELNTLKTRIGI